MYICISVFRYVSHCDLVETLNLKETKKTVPSILSFVQCTVYFLSRDLLTLKVVLHSEDGK